MRFLSNMKWSLLACVVTLFVGMYSMGVLGSVLYGYLCKPVLTLLYGNTDLYQRDWLWAWRASISAGMWWSVSFLVAGLVNGQLAKYGVSRAWRIVIYILVLWLGALVVWLALLISGNASAQGNTQSRAIECGQSNRAYIENTKALCF